MDRFENRNPPTSFSKNAVVVGAGPAGLCAADQLCQLGWSVTVVEQDPDSVGGLARTLVYDGFRFDVGAHRFFSKNSEIQSWWSSRLGEDFIEVHRMSRILYQRSYFNYPLQISNIFRMLGPLESARCVASYLRSRLRPRTPESSFESWVINRFGERLYLKFFKTYTEKVWGIPCDQISVDWAAQRIKGLSLSRLIVGALGFRNGPTGAKTLIDRFHYPRLGAGMMWEKTRSDLEAVGVKFIMGTRVTQIVRDSDRISEIRTLDQSGEARVFSADSFIFSMPLRDLVLSLEPALPVSVRAAAERLRYRDLLLVLVIVDSPDVFPDHWIYVHEPAVHLGRIANFRNWSIEMVPDRMKTGLALDYFSSVGDALWSQSDEELVELARAELEMLGIVRGASFLSAKVVRIEKAYPVLDDDYSLAAAEIRSELRLIGNLFVAGRNGMHKYNNQDHSMLTGMIAARAAANQPVDPWKVNIDGEYLEEMPQETSARLIPRRISASNERKLNYPAGGD